MKLSPDEAELYYKLMWPLQYYVNQKLNIVPSINSVKAYANNMSYEDKLPVRNALYEHPELVDAFIEENPAQLTPEELAIVRSWKNFVPGDFYIERFLKTGAILIGAKNQVYLVLGLTEGIEEVFGPYRRPPIMVKTVLLPFMGRIVYDGLFQTYSIFFGGGIKGDLKETYLAAKQNGRIIESLDSTRPAQLPEKARRQPARDWQAEVDEVVKAVNRLKGDKTPIQGEIFSLLKNSALLAQAVVQEPDDIDALWKTARRVDRALRRLEDVLNRAER